MRRETWIFLIVLGVFAVAALAVSIAAAVQGPALGGGPHGYFQSSELWFAAMGLWMLLFWALVIGGIVWLILILRPRPPERRPDDALETLRRRYAGRVGPCSR